MQKKVKKLIEEDIVKIGLEYGRNKSGEELAKELGTSRQRVCQIASTLRKNGILIPKGKMVFKNALKKLKEIQDGSKSDNVLPPKEFMDGLR